MNNNNKNVDAKEKKEEEEAAVKRVDKSHTQNQSTTAARDCCHRHSYDIPKRNVPKKVIDRMHSVANCVAMCIDGTTTIAMGGISHDRSQVNNSENNECNLMTQLT